MGDLSGWARREGGALYLDMDGVLMDFDSHILKWGCNWKGPTYHHLPEPQWTVEQATNDRRYKDAMAEHHFWQTMEPMKDARLLWDFCKDQRPHILTATPAGAKYKDRCAADKFAAVRRYFDPEFPLSRFHAVLRSEKKALARPGAVLVDDMAPNCDEWNAAGGTAILHKDALSTIKILREIFYV